MKPGDWVAVQVTDEIVDDAEVVRLCDDGWIEVEFDGQVRDEFHPDNVTFVEAAT